MTLGGCGNCWPGDAAPAQAAQAQNFHVSLEKHRDDCVAALGLAERRVQAAFQAMLAPASTGRWWRSIVKNNAPRISA